MEADPGDYDLISKDGRLYRLRRSEDTPEGAVRVQSGGRLREHHWSLPRWIADMSDDRWEKRARELRSVPYDSPASDFMPIANALQLGREMADARAEEIATKLDPQPGSMTWDDFPTRIYMESAATIARSFISKPERGNPDQPVAATEATPVRWYVWSSPQGGDLRDGQWIPMPADWPPKTREQVLEEALREIAVCVGPWEGWPNTPAAIARRALDWKPD